MEDGEEEEVYVFTGNEPTFTGSSVMSQEVV